MDSKGAEGDIGALFQFADPEIRVHHRPSEPDAAAEYRGLEGLMDYAVNWYSQWDEYTAQPIEIIDVGEQALVRSEAMWSARA